MINDRRGAMPGGLTREWLLSGLSLLVPCRRGRLGDIDRIGGGKGVLQPLLERPLEAALALLFPLAPRLLAQLMLRDGGVRNCHHSPPCRRLAGGSSEQRAARVYRSPCQRPQV